METHIKYIGDGRMERCGEFGGEEYQRRVARTDSNEKIADGTCFFHFSPIYSE